MAGVTPNVSRDSFDFSKAYEKLSLQQGVPIMDSDWNEALDNVWIRGVHLLNHLFIGNCRFPVVEPDGTEVANSGFLIKESTTDNSNNFTISAGYACCYGVVVGSTASMPPADVEYEDQEMFSGTISSVAGSDVIDTDKAFSASHDLVGCRLKFTSGAVSGFTRNITAVVSGTRLTIHSVLGVAPGDTYVIIPPALTTPPLGDRDDDVYLQVYFEDINENEDSAVNHPGTGIESVHKTKIRSVVRVAENSGYANTTAVGSLANYGVRTMKIATLERLNGNALILTAMIAEEDNTKSSIADLTASDIPFDLSNFTALGYDIGVGDANVQDAVDGIITSLSDDSNPALGTGLIGIADISGSPDIINAGTLYDAMDEMLGHVNDRVETINPTASPSAPVLVWRSHNHSSNATVDEDTTSMYILPASSLSTDGHAIAFCNGCYLDGANAYASLGSPATATMFVISGAGFVQLMREAPAGNWAWDSRFNWSGSLIASGGAANKLTMADTGFEMGVYNMPYGSTLPITFTPDTDGVDHSCEIYIKGSIPATVSPLKFFVAEDGTYEPGIFYTSDGIWITTNAVWDDATYKWIPGDSGEDAHAMHVTVNGIYFFHKSQNTAGYATGWSVTSWDAVNRLGVATGGAGISSGDDFYNGITSSGTMFEVIEWQAGAKLDFASLSENLTPTFYTAYNFKTRWAVAPASYTASLANNSANYSSVNVNNIDQNGFTMNVVFGPVVTDSGTPSYANGDVSFYN